MTILSYPVKICCVLLTEREIRSKITMKTAFAGYRKRGMHMKKIWMITALVLCVTALLLLNGCKDGKDAESSAVPTQPPQSTQAPTQPDKSEEETQESPSQEETQPQASQTEPQDSGSSGGGTQNNIPDLTGSWEPVMGESAASGNPVELSEIYGTGLSYGGSLDLNADGTFYVGVGIIKDNSAHKGTYTVDSGGVHVTYKNGTADTFEYLADYNGREAVKARQGDYYIYFCR